MNPRFNILGTDLSGLTILQRHPINDERGFLERLYCIQEFEGLLFDKKIAQVNRTMTIDAGTVRGMHFQLPPYAETKFVSCIKGEVFDVSVDIRRNSPTFLKWHAELLTDQNRKTIFIPEGFAHGFQTLTKNCELLYFHTACYQKNAEAGLNILDPILNIKWPLPINGLSHRDLQHPMLKDNFEGVVV